MLAIRTFGPHDEPSQNSGQPGVFLNEGSVWETYIQASGCRMHCCVPGELAADGFEAVRSVNPWRTE